MLLYADDIVLMTIRREDRTSIISSCEELSIANMFRFNVAKCEALSSTPIYPVHLYQQPVRQTQSFTYLSCVLIADDTDWNAQAKRMGSKTVQAASSLCSSGLYARNIVLSGP